MRRFFVGGLAALILLGLHGRLWGQMSPEEALEHLKERQATATQPSVTDLLDEISGLKRSNVELQQQLAAAQAEIKALQKQIADAAVPRPQTGNLDTDSLQGDTQWHRIKVGMTIQQSDAIRLGGPFTISAVTQSESANSKVVAWHGISAGCPDDLCTITYVDGKIDSIVYPTP